MTKRSGKKRSALPPHRKIENDLREVLAGSGFEPHSAFMSEVELCERFNVNVATVRKAVRRLQEEGLLYKVHRRGTFVAPPARNRLILIITTADDFSVVGRLTPVAAKYPNHHWLEMLVEDVRPHLSDIRHVFPRLMGAMFIRDLPKCIDVIRGFQSQGVPTLFYGSEVHAPFLERTHSILYKESAVVGMGMDHLRARGGTRFGFLGSDDWAAYSARHDEFLRWVERHGMSVNPGNIVNLPIARLKDTQYCYDYLRRRLKSKKFDANAFLCADDQSASIFVQAAAAVGVRIPSKIRVVGIEDNSTISKHAFPQLTSVRIPIVGDIQAGFHLMSEMVKIPLQPVRKWSEPSLIERASS